MEVHVFICTKETQIEKVCTVADYEDQECKQDYKEKTIRTNPHTAIVIRTVFGRTSRCSRRVPFFITVHIEMQRSILQYDNHKDIHTKAETRRLTSLASRPSNYEIRIQPYVCAPSPETKALLELEFGY